MLGNLGQNLTCSNISNSFKANKQSSMQLDGKYHPRVDLNICIVNNKKVKAGSVF